MILLDGCGVAAQSDARGSLRQTIKRLAHDHSHGWSDDVPECPRRWQGEELELLWNTRTIGQYMCFLHSRGKIALNQLAESLRGGMPRLAVQGVHSDLFYVRVSPPTLTARSYTGLEV